MKGRFLDRVIAAGRDKRSVALATDIKSGAQLLLEGERAEGDLALDEAGLAALRDAVRADRNRLIAAGATLVDEADMGGGTYLVMLRDPWGVPLQLCRRGKAMA